MSVEIVMPRAGLTMVEGTIGTWKAAEGAHVNKGDTIMEYENEKNMIEYEALSSGTLHILAKEGDTVKVGALMLFWPTIRRNMTQSSKAELRRRLPRLPHRRLPPQPTALLPRLRCRAPA